MYSLVEILDYLFLPSDNLRYGIKFAKRFIDAPDKKLLKKTGEMRWGGDFVDANAFTDADANADADTFTDADTSADAGTGANADAKTMQILLLMLKLMLIYHAIDSDGGGYDIMRTVDAPDKKC